MVGLWRAAGGLSIVMAEEKPQHRAVFSTVIPQAIYSSGGKAHMD